MAGEGDRDLSGEIAAGGVRLLSDSSFDVEDDEVGGELDVRSMGDDIFDFEFQAPETSVRPQSGLRCVVE